MFLVFLFVSTLMLFGYFSTGRAFAGCDDDGYQVTIVPEIPNPLVKGQEVGPVSITVGNFTAGTYTLRLRHERGFGRSDVTVYSSQDEDGTVPAGETAPITWTFDESTLADIGFDGSDNNWEMHFDIVWDSGGCRIDDHDFKIISSASSEGGNCTVEVISTAVDRVPGCYDLQQEYEVRIDAYNGLGQPRDESVCLSINGGGRSFETEINARAIESATRTYRLNADFFYNADENVSVEVYYDHEDEQVSGDFYSPFRCTGPKKCEVSPDIEVINACQPSQIEEEPNAGDIGDFNLCKQIPGEPGEVDCDTASPSTPKGKCCDCTNNQNGIWTAVGCIRHDGGSIVQSFIKIGLSVAGGSAVIMILIAGLMFTVSRGDPKRTGEAKDMLTSAVIGLLFIIFSITILEFIGVSILRIPGFGT